MKILDYLISVLGRGGLIVVLSLALLVSACGEDPAAPAVSKCQAGCVVKSAAADTLRARVP